MVDSTCSTGCAVNPSGILSSIVIVADSDAEPEWHDRTSLSVLSLAAKPSLWLLMPRRHRAGVMGLALAYSTYCGVV